MSQGAIYFACGQRYIDEALHSASTLKRHMPHLSTTLFTHENVQSPYFNHVEVIPELAEKAQTKANRIRYVIRSPYEQTLFLDTDTHICDNFSELFSLLERFDIAMAHAPWSRVWDETSTRYLPELPHSFPEFNTGVILFRRTPAVLSTLQQWLKIFEASGAPVDQPSMRKAIYESDLRFVTLAPEYNFRIGKRPNCTNGTVKIIHGRHPRIEQIEQLINETPRFRIVRPQSTATRFLSHFPLLRGILGSRLHREKDFVIPPR